MSALTKRLALALLLVWLCLPAYGNWTIDWYSIDGGGTMASSAGQWELKGTIGQPDATAANALTGSGWTLTGGFWAMLAETLDRIFHDRFQAE